MAYRGIYRGNSALGQLADESGNGNNLTLTGVVNNAAAPAAPEGDRWLAYQVAGVSANYFSVPSGVFNQAEGFFEFYFVLETDPGPAINLMISRIFKSVVPVEISDIFIFGPGGRILRMYLFNAGAFVFDFNSAPIALGPTPRLVRFEWKSGVGVSLFLDGALVGTSAISFTWSPIWIDFAGDRNSTSNSFLNGGLDFLRFSDTLVAPSSSSIFQNSIRRRRR